MKIVAFVLTVMLSYPTYSDDAVPSPDDILHDLYAEFFDIRLTKNGLCADYYKDLEDIKEKSRKKLDSMNPEDSEFFLEVAIMSDSKESVEKVLITNPLL